MSSSPPDKQPDEEVSVNPDSANSIDSDTLSTTPEDNPEPTSKSQNKLSETKSSRLNPLTWWRNKSNDDDNDQSSVVVSSSPSADTKSPIQISSPSLPTAKPTLSAPTTQIKLFAPLDTVGTENYLRYGLEGPRHYVMGIIESVPTPENITIQLEVIGSDSTAKFNADDIQLKRLAHEPQNQTVWGIHNPSLHTQIIWIWDFFRMLSSIQLSVETPQSPPENEQWAKLASTLQTLVPNDQLIIRVHNNVGSITQIHHVKSE